jgi:hypothetical protein
MGVRESLQTNWSVLLFGYLITWPAIQSFRLVLVWYQHIFQDCQSFAIYIGLIIMVEGTMDEDARP